jgi:hypothetical protein
MLGSRAKRNQKTIETGGDDLRPDPLEGRKATLQMILGLTASNAAWSRAACR